MCWGLCCQGTREAHFKGVQNHIFSGEQEWEGGDGVSVPLLPLFAGMALKYVPLFILLSNLVHLRFPRVNSSTRCSPMLDSLG